MELDLGPEIAEFRAETRDWIAGHAPAGLAELTDWNNVVTTGGYGSELRAGPMRHPPTRSGRASWPRPGSSARSGRSSSAARAWTRSRVAIFNEELYRAGVPRVVRGMGESLVGPSVIVHGTPEQQAHFLPRIITGEDVYCQGFSEPGTGSDLAGLQTKGEIDGDEIVITGQKLWTSGAARANKMFVLCRTDPAAEKHAGISFVLIDFKDPAVTYQPVRQMSGAAEFCEDFLDGVRAPLFNVIGGLNNGWRVAMTTLGYERGGSATILHLAYEREFWELAETARKRGNNTDPVIRQKLAWAYSQVEIMRFSGLRALAQLAQGRQPGPEASINKLFWSEYHKKLGEIAMDIEGTDGLVRPEGAGYATTGWQNVFLASRAGSIYSGTNEIQRNIIAERALGLPKEPRVRA